ncbi:MAG: DUF1553 domain-containing protein [Planctomycetia bacterium]|nr:DUF1553 domain-containing protein [Planctomycetia bacterium]
MRTRPDVAGGMTAVGACARVAIWLIVWLCGDPRSFGNEPAPAVKVEFNRHIRPILSNKCFRCHGPDGVQRKADLRLDVRAAAIAEKDGIAAVVPGKPDESELFRRITAADDGERMPPAGSGLKLEAHEIELLRRWIAGGAEYQPHWAFLPPRAPQIPPVRNATWIANPIDNFVLARLEDAEIVPAPEANRERLLRRVSLDLTGLPPTLEEIDAFLADRAGDAYERVVDRLLRSPRYGEHWAVDWLDAARYGDTDGYFTDAERKLWRWRDWVIRALNANLPFDRFTIEQLAGDLLPEPSLEQQVATGFHRNHTMNNESGIIDEEYRVEYVADRTDTTGTVWLGLTLGCARCHDHKYDPITQKEYYQLFAYFNNLPEKGLIYAEKAPEPSLVVLSPEETQRRQSLKDRRAQLEQEFAPHDAALKAEFTNWEARAQDDLPARSTDGLLAEFEFDSQLSDAGGRGIIPTAVGPLRYKDGFSKMSLEFDASQQVNLPADLGLDANSPWMISFWTRPLLIARGAFLSFTAEQSASDGQIAPASGISGLHIVSQRLHVVVSLVDATGQAGLKISTAEPLGAAKWQHVSVGYDGSGRAAGLSVFVDGTAARTAILRDDPLQPLAKAVTGHIGRDESVGGFNGRIDNLRIFQQSPTRELASAVHSRDVVGAILQTAADKRNAAQKQQLFEYYILKHATPEIQRAWKELAEARRREAEFEAVIPTTLIMREQEKARDTFVLDRGQYDKPTQQVSPNVPTWLPPLPAGAPPNRLALARWLVGPDNPLTARVTVNRYWQHFFGEGLVKTSNDFGIQGELPSHPDLLDWLALRFISSGWDVKALHKLIVMSATYRQSPACSLELRQRDPENRLLARGPRLRLGAEVIRDQALFACDLLVEQIGGPSVKPYQPPGLWEAVSYNAEQSYVPGLGNDLYRRSLYTFWKRQAPPPALLCFDGPTREQCVVKRPRTNTPLQALVLQNDPTYIEAARVLATRLLSEPSADEKSRIRSAFRRIAGREPAAIESATLSRLLEKQLIEYRSDPAAARALIGVGESVAPAGTRFDAPQLAAWTTVVSALLNLDETVTKP